MIKISYISKYFASIINNSILLTFIILFITIRCNLLVGGETISKFRALKSNNNMYQKEKTFEDLFIFKDIFIDLEGYEMLVGRISKLEVSKNGDILFLDDITKQVWFIKKDSKMALEIHPKNHIPGIRWHPAFISFAPDGYIYVISAPLSNVLYIFDLKGEFFKKITYEKRLTSIRDMKFSPQGDLLICFTAHNQEFGLHKLKFLKNEKEIISIETLALNPTKYPNVISRYDHSIMCETDEFGYIYQAYKTEPAIYKYSLNFEFIEKYEKKPKNYHFLERDVFPNELSSLGLKKVLNMISKATVLENLFYFNCCKILMIQYVDISVKGTILDFLTTNGKYFTKGNIKSSHRIMAVQGKSMYIVEAATDLDKNGDLPNPKILRYELISELNLR